LFRIRQYVSGITAVQGTLTIDTDKSDRCITDAWYIAVALKAALEEVVMQLVLNDHYRQYPDSRPTLGDLAVATAELDGHPMAAEPGRIREAAAEIKSRHPDATSEDVLLWAEARALELAPPLN
jgi:hypothetical protein